MMTSPACGMDKELSAEQDNLEVMQQEEPVQHKALLQSITTIKMTAISLAQNIKKFTESTSNK